MHVYLITLFLCHVLAMLTSCCVCAGVSPVRFAPGTTWRDCVSDAEGSARLPLFREVRRPVGPAATPWRGAQHPIGTLPLLSDHMLWNHLDKLLLAV